MVKKEWSEQDLLVKAQNYCSLAEHCALEVREKLYQWGATAALQDTILQQLCQSGFIDERRYAAAFVHDKVAIQGWGREKIRMMLVMKQIASPVVEEAIRGIDEDVYHQQMDHLIEQKKGLEPIKIARFLAQRGFGISEIRSKIPLSPRY